MEQEYPLHSREVPVLELMAEVCFAASESATTKARYGEALDWVTLFEEALISLQPDREQSLALWAAFACAARASGRVVQRLHSQSEAACDDLQA